MAPATDDDTSDEWVVKTCTNVSWRQNLSKSFGSTLTFRYIRYEIEFPSKRLSTIGLQSAHTLEFISVRNIYMKLLNFMFIASRMSLQNAFYCFRVRDAVQLYIQMPFCADRVTQIFMIFLWKQPQKLVPKRNSLKKFILYFISCIFFQIWILCTSNNTIFNNGQRKISIKLVTGCKIATHILYRGGSEEERYNIQAGD